MLKVRVRYAPSPTGIPHVGNIRTALFNYLFAKKENGQFLLRIEDTDRNRLVPEAVEKIKESLKVLGLNWDGEEIHQSSRLDLYSKYLEELKTKNLAYEDEGAWRFKIEKGKTLTWQDAVHGEVSFKSDVLEDFIIIKSDGYPTYHFASVVDDHDMEISHVFRGDEWISSTPKHLLLYQAFGWEPPTFVHLPPILGPNNKKLSKRQGAKSVIEFIQEGYLPEAIVNFMAFLGWAPKDDKEIFSLEELISEFSIERINKNSPIFNVEKLKWFNGQWIRALSDEELAKKIAKVSSFKTEEIIKVLPIVKDRMSTLHDFVSISGFLFNENIEIDPKGILISESILKKLIDAYQKISDWTKENIQSTTISIMEKENLKKPEMYKSIGIAVSGSQITPPIFDSLQVLGKEKTIARLNEAIQKKK